VSQPDSYVLFIAQQPNDGQMVLLRLPIDSDMPTLVQGFRDFALACGYHADVVRDYLGEPT
jgi:hypothetical protein